MEQKPPRARTGGVSAILPDHVLNRQRSEGALLDPGEPKPVYSQKAAAIPAIKQGSTRLRVPLIFATVGFAFKF
jgi:hypothetical protein